MIDIHAPMEFDDGTPVTLAKPQYAGYHGVFKVNWVGKGPSRGIRYRRHDTQSWWFRVEDGRFEGGDKETHHYIVNGFLPTDTIVEDWS